MCHPHTFFQIFETNTKNWISAAKRSKKCNLQKWPQKSSRSPQWKVMTIFWFFHTKKYKKSNFSRKKIKKIQPPKMNTVYFKGHVHLLRKCSGYISGKQCWKYFEVKMYSRYMKCLKLYPQIFSRLFPKKRGWGLHKNLIS